MQEGIPPLERGGAGPAETFQRTRWLALFMLVPVYGWLIFLYLNRVSRADDQDPAVRSQPRIRLAA